MSSWLEFVEEPDEWPEDFVPQVEDEPRCFQFDGGSMAMMLAVMERAGVIDSDQHPPGFPDWPPPGLGPGRANLLERYLDDEDQRRRRLAPAEVPIWEASERADDQAQRTPPQSPGKVPAFKFRSNDHWWGSPTECRLIHAALREAVNQRSPAVFALLASEGYGTERAIELLELWAGYNRLAAEYGGYRVY